MIDLRPFIVISALLAPSGAAATELCAQIGSQTGPDRGTAFDTNAKQTCAALIVEAAQITCQWEFTYRDLAAMSLFDNLNTVIPICLDTYAATVDQPVNHPDFYDLRRYALEDGVLSVSIKDKASLQKTFVFLRHAPSPK